jgi:predicted ATPase
MLLILDGCEHVIEAAATLAERTYVAAPLVQILATSREALRAEGENVYRLAPLESPPERAGLSALEALRYPAVELFVERVAAGAADFALSDADAPVVASICRNLDGVALAIELAAGRVGTYSVQDTARLLEDRLHLLWPGRRTAAPRHQTLAATLDWSYDLLGEPERIVLRRLSVFAGFFDLEAARVVASGDNLDAERVLDAVAGLAAKSLVSVDPSGPATRHRLLDATRAYAAGKLAVSGENAQVAARHAAHFQELLVRLDAAAPDPSREEALALYGDHIGNVCAALDWCFNNGNHDLGGALVTAAAPLFFRLSLLSEYRRWTERALAALQVTSRGTRNELELQAALGQCIMFTRGNTEEVRTAYESALKIAERIGCGEWQIELLGWLHFFCLRTGDHHGAFDYAERCHIAATRFGGRPAAVATARCYLGIACHWLGRYADANVHFVAALDAPSVLRRRGSRHPGFDYRTYAYIGLARTLWLRGRADQAAAAGSRATEEVVEFGQPLMQCMIFLFNAIVRLWRGDLADAEAAIDAGIAVAERHSMGPYLAAGRGMRGEIAVRRGMAKEGVAILTAALDELERDRYALMTTEFTLAIAEGLRAMGRFDDGLAVIESSIRRAERESDLLAMPEMFRIRGKLLACAPGVHPREAEISLTQALELAKSSGGLAWELRAATSLARLWSSQDRSREAELLLTSVHGKFTEGFGTVDLRAAERLLRRLRGTDAGAIRE